MPYTPPSHQSPVSSRNTTPAISRNASYSQDIAALSPSLSTRPSLPRSISSATYLNKHRRSPSITSSGPHDTTGATYKFNSGSRDDDVLHMNPSLRQSPPPVNDLVIPSGAIISPPDSSENSDGDEASSMARRREVETTWNELQEAVRSMTLKREPSPVRTDLPRQSADSEPTTSVTSPTKLSPEARKISHSRSSTETAIPIVNSPIQMSGSEESDEDLPGGKPPLVRKKSGELVKPALRPSSRRRYSSMPGTPTYHKSVHFNDNGNQTRHFLQVDKPSAVSAGSSPVEVYDSESEYPFTGVSAAKSRPEWEFKLANFPSEDDSFRKTKTVWVERFFLTPDNKSLVGQVAVANISFHKSVVARFTLDYWKTTSEVSADFSHDIRKDAPDGYDRFNFSIRLADQANLETKTLLVCVRYNVAGQEHWDNNDNTNYQIDFVKKANTRTASHTFNTPLGARPVNAIPRSRHSPPASRGRARAPSIDDDMTAQLDDSRYHFGTAAHDLLGDDAQPAIKLRPRSKRGVMFPNSTSQPSQGLGGRYDFGASLSAALSTAQDKLGKQSGLMSRKDNPTPGQGYFNHDAPDSPPKKALEAERPEALTTDRPAMGSAQYRDLVSKFCYFTPTATAATKTASPVAGTPTKKAPSSMDGSSEHVEFFLPGAVQSSSPQRASSPQVEGPRDRSHASPSASDLGSRTGSPARVAHHGHHSSARGTSPGTFGYPYHHHKRDGYLSDSPAPTAIRG